MQPRAQRFMHRQRLFFPTDAFLSTLHAYLNFCPELRATFWIPGPKGYNAYESCRTYWIRSEPANEEPPQHKQIEVSFPLACFETNQNKATSQKETPKGNRVHYISRFNITRNDKNLYTIPRGNV